jgi:citrate lyase alpha subunit
VALQMGAAIGVAVLATLSTSRTEHLLTTGVGAHEALTSGYRLGFVVATGSVVAALALTALLRSSRAEHQPLGVKEEAS